MRKKASRREQWEMGVDLLTCFLVELAFIPSLLLAAGIAVELGTNDRTFWYVFIPTLFLVWFLLAAFGLTVRRRFDQWADDE